MTEAKMAARPWRRAAITGALVLAAVVLAAGAWICVRGYLAKGELDDAQTLAGDIERAMVERDVAAALDAVDDLGTHARRAAELTSDPVWRVAEVLPFVGPNLTAVRVVSAELDRVTAEAIGPLVTTSQTLSSASRMPDGAIDLAALSDVQAPVAHARLVLGDASESLADVDAAALIDPVRDGLMQLTDVVSHLAPVVASLDDAATLLPPMLGADGPRTILVALQNNAELRTGGGITGSFIELRAEGGRLALSAQADSSNFAARQTGILPVPESTTALYGDRVGRFVQNATMSADFELTAQLASEWWRTLGGVTPDAVVAVDPVVLRALLAAIGPIQAGGQELSADNLISRLLVDPYLSTDSAGQTALFRETAAAVFSRLTSADADLMTLATALMEPVAEGRVSVWSAHDEEQRVISGTALAGPAARQAHAGPDAFAVYLNDATAGKMDSLLEVGIQWGVAECRSDGHRDIVVSVTLTSRAPQDAASELPASMTGGGWYGARAGDIATNISVSAPRGSYFGGVTIGGAAVPSADAEDAGFPVSTTRVDLAPGQAVTVDFRFLSAEPRDVTPKILHTPLLEDPEIAEIDTSCS